MEVLLYDVEGRELERIALDESVFGVPMHEAVVHQAMVRQRANARIGTASAKTRSEVSGSTRKLYRQKHTGRARAGSLRSPLRRHGGTIFGPKPRDHRQDLPKKMRRLAIRCLLSDKVANGELKVVDRLELNEPKTGRIAEILQTLRIQRSALIALDIPQENVTRSARNLPGIKTIQARQLNVADLVSHQSLIITREAVNQVVALWGTQQSTVVGG